MKTTTATEAARLLRVADKTIRDWLRKGRFPGAKLIKRNGIHQWSIPLTDIEAVQREEQKATESEGGLPSLPELAAQLMALERRVAELEQARLTKTFSTTGSTVPSIHKHKPTSDDLPDDLVSCPQFAKLHNIAASTVQKAIETGRLDVVRGQWKVGKAVVQKALDAKGRSEFYELYWANEHFMNCPECPHVNIK